MVLGYQIICTFSVVLGKHAHNFSGNIFYAKSSDYDL